MNLKTLGFDGPVKQQYSCGSCWAFSAIAAIEGVVAVKNNAAPLDLSEKQLVDCTYTTSGCGGGWMSTAFDYLRSVGVTYNEVSWPYTKAWNS